MASLNKRVMFTAIPFGHRRSPVAVYQFKPDSVNIDLRDTGNAGRFFGNRFSTNKIMFTHCYWLTGFAEHSQARTGTIEAARRALPVRNPYIGRGSGAGAMDEPRITMDLGVQQPFGIFYHRTLGAAIPAQNPPYAPGFTIDVEPQYLDSISQLTTGVAGLKFYDQGTFATLFDALVWARVINAQVANQSVNYRRVWFERSSGTSVLLSATDYAGSNVIEGDLGNLNNGDIVVFEFSTPQADEPAVYEATVSKSQGNRDYDFRVEFFPRNQTTGAESTELTRHEDEFTAFDVSNWRLIQNPDKIDDISQAAVRVYKKNTAAMSPLPATGSSRSPAPAADMAAGSVTAAGARRTAPTGSTGGA